MASWQMLFFCIISLLLQVGCGSYNYETDDNKYDSYTMVRMIPTDNFQLEVTRRFEDPTRRVEVLKGTRGLNDSLDLLVPADVMAPIQDFAQVNGLKFEVKETQYGRKFEALVRVPRRRVMRSFNLYDYNSFASIQEYIETVARRHPDLVRLQTVGNSYQGRRIKLVKISADFNAQNPIIFLDAGIHAREWVAPSMALYIIHRLTSDPNARQNELLGVDWYILPVVNPDGYEFTRTSKANRLWRKTRSKTGASNCYGVDGNRNYGLKWGVSGVSNNPCDKETYAGPKPFSEPETQIVRNVMMENAQHLKLYVSIHAYGQYLLYPWGFTGDYLPKQWRKLDSLAKSVSEAVVKAGGEPFKVLSAGKWYPAAGGSDDFAFGAVGVPYSYTMELTNGYEFIFPKEQLRVILPQFYEGFREFGKQIRHEFPNKYLKAHSESSSFSDED